MKRELLACGFMATSDRGIESSLDSWLLNQAEDKPHYLLAHAVDGVIWGLVTSSSVMVSNHVSPEISPPLRIETLRHLRLFNEDREARLWRTGNHDWRALTVVDVEDETAVAIDEMHLLWGTYAQPASNGFVKLEDGQQGLRHVVPPIPSHPDLSGSSGGLDDDRLSRVCLKVRHYLTEDALGVNKITLSRLVGLGVMTYG